MSNVDLLVETFYKLVKKIRHLKVEGVFVSSDNLDEEGKIDFVWKDDRTGAYAGTEVGLADDRKLFGILRKMALKALRRRDSQLVIYSNPSEKDWVEEEDTKLYQRIGVIPLSGDDAFRFLSDVEVARRGRWDARKDWVSVVASSMNEDVESNKRQRTDMGGRRRRSKSTSRKGVPKEVRELRALNKISRGIILSILSSEEKRRRSKSASSTKRRR